MTAAIPQRRPRGRPRDSELPERRRREILEVAARTFAEHGYADTDVQAIADELQVGKGTVYRYFPSKEHLFLAAVDQGMQQLRATVDTAAAEARTDVGRIERGIAAYLTFFDKHPEVIELIILERANFRHRKRPTYFAHKDAHIEPWRELFRRLIAARAIRNMPVNRITDVISDLLYGTIFTNHFAGRRKSLASQCEDVLDVIFRGLLVNRK